MEQNLNHWVKYIGSQSIPVFNSTIQAVLKLSTDDKSSYKQLSDTILQDAALTTRVLRVANSPYYNRLHTQIKNIRRIILLIGFRKITEICLTLSILETLLDKKTRKNIYNISAKSYLAAIQARSIAELYGLKNSDMVYLATLLYNIGEIAFWSLTGKSAKLISDLLNKHDAHNEETQENILGTTFRKLSLGLISEWEISDLLKNALSNPESRNPEVICIMHGYNIADSIIDNAKNFDSIVDKIAKDTRHSFVDISEKLKKNITIANNTYRYYIN